MNTENTSALASLQYQAANHTSEVHQAPEIDLQVRKLCQRFALAPDMARAIAALAFAAEVRT